MIMIITELGSVGNRGFKKVLIVFRIATNSFLLPSTRTSIESRQLRPATGLALRPEPATGLGRMFTEPRAAWVGGNFSGEKILFVNFRWGEG